MDKQDKWIATSNQATRGMNRSQDLFMHDWDNFPIPLYNLFIREKNKINKKMYWILKPLRTHLSGSSWIWNLLNLHHTIFKAGPKNPEDLFVRAVAYLYLVQLLVPATSYSTVLLPAQVLLLIFFGSRFKKSFDSALSKSDRFLEKLNNALNKRPVSAGHAFNYQRYLANIQLTESIRHLLLTLLRFASVLEQLL